jgi:hypothetical protein
MSLKTATRKFAAVSLLFLAAAGALIAETATKQRDFDGQIKLSLCGPDGKGGWVVKDTLSGNLRFPFSVTDLASGKTLKSDFVWNGRTAKGHAFRVRLTGQGQASFNAANGQIEERLPLEVEVAGRKESFLIALSTETVKTAIGSLSGKRARINGNIGEMALVGESPLKQINPFEPSGTDSAAHKPGADKIMVIAVLTGRVVAKDAPAKQGVVNHEEQKRPDRK